jgi:hypothetical protein
MPCLAVVVVVDVDVDIVAVAVVNDEESRAGWVDSTGRD